MSTKVLKRPLTQEQAETPFVIMQDQFLGMIKDIPVSKIPHGFSYTNRNMIDYVQSSHGRFGTRNYSSVAIPAGTLNAQLGHTRQPYILSLRGTAVYSSPLDKSSFLEVVNINAEDPADAQAQFIEFDDEMWLCAGNIYRIILNEDNPYMFRANLPLPAVMITDQAETKTNIFGYRLMYSLSRITGSGNRNRVSNPDVGILVFETGTGKDPNAEKNYGECFFQYPIGDNLTQNHVISYLTCPFDNQEITHYSVYRSKNIGRHSRGETNNPAILVWDEDAPVAKAFTITIVGNNFTVTGVSDNALQRMDTESVLYDSAGNSGTIESYTSGTAGALVAGHTLGAGVIDVAIGEGRVMRARQTGVNVQFISGDAIVAADAGRTIFWADGGFTMLRSVDVVAQTAVSVDAGAVHAEQAATMQAISGSYAFRRHYNDIIMDDATGEGEIGLHERMLAAMDHYFPQVNFVPLPSSDMGIIDSGKLIVSKRDSLEYYYSDVGYKKYNGGYYRIEQQYEKLASPIRLIDVVSGTAIFFTTNKTFINTLNVVTSVGNKLFGEYIGKLGKSNEVGSNIGVYHWRAVVPIDRSRRVALTNEPAIRIFNGMEWGEENLANEGNLPAVQSEIDAIDPNYEVIAAYSQRDGYMLWYFKWVPVDELCDVVIIDCGGSGFVGDDVWVDIGGVAPGGDDDIVDVGNNPCG